MKRNELIIDSFAGGGGASLGIFRALGRHPDIAINHDKAAIEMHAANHPQTLHVCEDVWHARLKDLVAGPVGLLWASPDCKHFSRAKGAVPVSKDIRSLAWVVVRWASQVRPRIIILENVREFEQWGPLVPALKCRCGWRGTEGQARLARKHRRCPRCNSVRLAVQGELPCPNRKGMTFRLFCNRLRGNTYNLEWRNLDAANHDTPTHRKRLVLVARCDRKPIVWPKQTHFDPKCVHPGGHAWHTAAECIDWDIPCPSIFERKRELRPATMRRVAHGIKRYVLDSPQPFIVQISNSRTTGRGAYVWPTGEPLRTQTTANSFALVTPYLVGCGGPGYGGKPRPVDQPFGTVLQENHSALVAPHLMPLTHSGERRSYDPREPLPTVTTAKRGEIAVLAPVIASLAHGNGPDGTFGDSRSTDLRQPLGTIHAGGGNHALLAASLVQTGYGEREGQRPRAIDIEQPLGTVVAGGPKHALVAAFMAKHFGGVVGVPIDTPLPTATARSTQNQLVAANLIHLNHGDKQWSGLDDPMRTVTTGKHAALVYSFLTKYFGTAIGQSLHDPLHTTTTRDRFGLVIVMLWGEPWVIVDIGMRMLTPRELARAQGFPDDYILTGSKTNQVARIGNSVCPPLAEAIVRANCLSRRRRVA